MHGFVLFRQLQLPVPHPSKRSCCVFCQSDVLTRDILRTPWSSRPDTVTLLESSGLLNDLTRNKLHTEPDGQAVDFRRC